MSAQIKRRTVVDVAEIHDNTSTALITITDDKLKLILIDYVNKAEAAKSWQAPLGTVVTIVLVFCSAEFKSAFFLSSETWRAIFIIGLIVSFIWLVISSYRGFVTQSIDDVIQTIKNKSKT